MAKSTSGQITKIYQLKTLGYADVSKDLDNLAKKFEAIKKAKQSAQTNYSLAKDAAEAGKYSEELAELVVKEQQLLPWVISFPLLAPTVAMMELQPSMLLTWMRQRVWISQQPCLAMMACCGQMAVLMTSRLPVLWAAGTSTNRLNPNPVKNKLTNLFK